MPAFFLIEAVIFRRRYRLQVGNMHKNRLMLAFFSYFSQKQSLIENDFSFGNTQGDQSLMKTASKLETIDSHSLLQEHSRSFALSLLALPSAQRPFVGLTYLAARLADTLADSGRVSPDQRLAYLEKWENALLSQNFVPWEMKDSVGSFSESEMKLILSAKPLAAAYRAVDESLRHHGDEVLKTLFKAMSWQVRTFASASAEEPVYGIQNEQELDWYCYQHAGCVGTYWTRVFGLPSHLEHLADSYGKALERINILRDVVDDRQQGRILLPKTDLDSFGFKTSEPWKEKEYWKAYVNAYVDRTQSMLIHGAQFCDAIPRWQLKLRWASMMPFKIGCESLSLYLTELSKEKTSKISRKQVKSLARQSFFDVLLGRHISSRLSF